MLIRYLLILGIGHLLGDFYLQNEKLASYKDRSYKGVLVHSLEYCLVMMIVIIPVFSLDLLGAAACAGLLHFLIDTIKYVVFRKKTGKKSYRVFVLDQIAHIAVIIVLALIMEYWNFVIGEINVVQHLISSFNLDIETVARWIFCLLFVGNPVNIFIQNFLREYKPATDGGIIKAENKVGRKVGTIERLIMLIFLANRQFSALGFILTAKSIARYDRITKDEKFAEYYLLGTLISTLCVIVCGMIL